LMAYLAFLESMDAEYSQGAPREVSAAS
jgi:hypothetical protein